MGEAPLPPPLPGGEPPPPPPAVVGYGRRTVPGAGPRGPASILQQQAGAQPLPHTYLQGGGLVPDVRIGSRRYPFERNAVLTIAQLLAVVQGILGLINGINALRQGIGATFVFGQFGVPGLAGGIIIDGALTTALSLGVIAAAAVATSPSNVARWLLVAWEVVVFLVTLGLLTQPLFFFGAAQLVLIPLLAGGVNIIHPYIVLTMAGIIIFGFAIYPPTYGAYSGDKGRVL